MCVCVCMCVCVYLLNGRKLEKKLGVPLGFFPPNFRPKFYLFEFLSHYDWNLSRDTKKRIETLPVAA